MRPCGFLGLPGDWESSLEMQLLIAQTNHTKRKAYICSPCRGDTPGEVYGNMAATRYYMYYVCTHMNLCPCAPHAYLPAILNDRIIRERNLVLNFGLELLSMADELLVCGHILSDGMRGEIKRAAELGVPVRVFSPNLYSDIKDIAGCASVCYNGDHIPLVLNAGELFEMEE